MQEPFANVVQVTPRAISRINLGGGSYDPVLSLSPRRPVKPWEVGGIGNVLMWVLGGLLVLGIAAAAAAMLLHQRHGHLPQVLVIINPDPHAVIVGSGGADLSITDCEQCVGRGQVWQIEKCFQKCEVADVPCFGSADGCRVNEEHKAASAVCRDMKDCRSCVPEKHCAWRKLEMDCFMASNYWGPKDDIVKHQQVGECPP
uniref:PSI domain-containing protein n=1 Tax=Alexandrium monilatum TaxID=311494 RepID=A0A7S4UBI2_9DINO|mmetsp:Transcript_71651/g.213848  ORF Transcript_71651/g.213848 Transcript_71651/m.213848 type:complete len:201 (+) Transcript_71651:39-641(+)